MAGTDGRKAKAEALAACVGGPAIVLVKPQLGENIGMVARAMLNCGLSDLRLVAPRPGWSREKCEAAAAGADAFLDSIREYPTTAEAVADLHRLYATTARGRDMNKPVVTARQAAAEMRGGAAGGTRYGVLFGREAWGLDNDDVALADAIVQVPLNPGFRSLNLAQAVLLLGYEWFQSGSDAPGRAHPVRAGTRPASRDELHGLFDHLEGALDASGFLRVAEKRPIMVRNLRTILLKADLTEQEVRTLRGVIKSLSRHGRTEG